MLSRMRKKDPIRSVLDGDGDDEEVEEKDANRPLQAHPDGEKGPKTPKAVEQAKEKESVKATGSQKQSAKRRK